MPDPRPPTRPDEHMSDPPPPDPPHLIRMIDPIIPCRQHHQVYHQTVQWIQRCRRVTNQAGNPAVKQQKQSISSSSGLNRLGGDVTLPSQSQPSQPILPTVVAPSPPAILMNPEAEPILSKKKQLHLLRRAVRPRSRRQERSRSQVRIQTTKIRLGHLPRMNLQLHPTSTRTIQSTCRRNPTVRKNYSLTFQLHPALEVHRGPRSTLTEKKMNQKTLRGRGSTTIRKPPCS